MKLTEPTDTVQLLTSSKSGKPLRLSLEKTSLPLIHTSKEAATPTQGVYRSRCHITITVRILAAIIIIITIRVLAVVTRRVLAVVTRRVLAVITRVYWLSHSY